MNFLWKIEIKNYAIKIDKAIKVKSQFEYSNLKKNWKTQKQKKKLDHKVEIGVEPDSKEERNVENECIWFNNSIQINQCQEKLIDCNKQRKKITTTNELQNMRKITNRKIISFYLSLSLNPTIVGVALLLDSFAMTSTPPFWTKKICKVKTFAQKKKKKKN